MAEEFITFRKLHDTEIGRDLIEQLEKHSIEAQIDDTPHLFDGDNHSKETASEITIKLRRTDFTKAEELLRGIVSKLMQNIDKGYYLFELTDEELEKVVNKHQINEFDLLLAQQILRDRKG